MMNVPLRNMSSKCKKHQNTTPCLGLQKGAVQVTNDRKGAENHGAYVDKIHKERCLM